MGACRVCGCMFACVCVHECLWVCECVCVDVVVPIIVSACFSFSLPASFCCLALDRHERLTHIFRCNYDAITMLYFIIYVGQIICSLDHLCACLCVYGSYMGARCVCEIEKA